MLKPNRLNSCFANLHAQQRVALIPFITAGDPIPTITVPLMHALVAAGADIIELGIPFSDPMADGPVIQRASERALASGTNLRAVLQMVKTFRTENTTTPIVFMGYLNPIEIMGITLFAELAQASGVDGVLTVDMPPEESSELVTALYAHQIAPIFLLAPTSTTERIVNVCKQAQGYLYYVSLKGVTGSAHLEVNAVNDKLMEIRQCTDLPIAVGFGIRDPETAAQIAKISDAVVVGSALVEKIEHVDRDALISTLSCFVRELREAIDK